MKNVKGFNEFLYEGQNVKKMIKWDKEAEELEAKLERDDVRWNEKEKAQKRIEKLQLMQDKLSTKFNAGEREEYEGHTGIGWSDMFGETN
tara:strand:+ start:1979 stop:2248 length:270 start_codon:yes stop_codon:yes gene_type:complete